MGNTTSTDRGGNVPSKNVKLIVKPPVDWNERTETQQFVMVSPQSDISNPSQIRHPHHRTKVALMTTKTPMRKRTSKVVSKGVPPSRQHANGTTNLPAPERFYFDPLSTTDSSQRDDLVTDSRDNDVPFKQSKTLNEKQCFPHGVKKKATRAKQLLKGCWKEQKENFEGCYRNNDPKQPHERFKSMSPSRRMNRFSAATKPSLPSFGRNQGVQFLPECQEEDMPEQNTMSPRQVYLHDEEVYLKRMETRSNPNETPVRDGNLGNVQQPNDTSLAEDSPVAKLFGHRTYHSDTGLAEPSTLNQDTIGRNSYPQMSKQERVPNTVERDIQKQIDAQLQRDTKRDDLRLDEQMDGPTELKFQSRSEEIGRVKRLRESYLQRLESTRRLSEAEESRRQSVESKLEKMREEASQEEFVKQNVTQQVLEPSSPFDEPKEAPRAVPFDEQQETNMAPRGRASAPVQRSIFDDKVTIKPIRKSEPIQKTTKTNITKVNHLPVLLKIAGWEQSTNRTSAPKQPTTKTEPELPAILTLAGWKQNANEKKMRRSSSVEGISKSHGTKEINEKPTTVKQKRVIDAVKEDRVIEKTASNETRGTDEDNEQRIPLPSILQKESQKDTPVVKKMSRMLMETRRVASVFDSPEKRNQYGVLKSHENSDVSFDSTDTPISQADNRPMLTSDALINAAFLFSPGYVDNNPSLLRMGDTKSETSTTISTLDSRNRLLPSYTGKNASDSELSRGSASMSTSTNTKSGIYTAPTSMLQPSCTDTSEKPHPVLKHNSSFASRSSDSNDRHVRFSIGNKVVASSVQKPMRKSDESSGSEKSPLRTQNLEVPDIKHSLSDLTDVFSSNGRDSVVTLDIHQLRSKKESIQEPPREFPTMDKSVFELKTSPPTNWEYTTDMDNGVTPLRSGKGGGPSNGTNSVYKRFNQAKNRFSNATKVSPAKKRSPVKARTSNVRSFGGFVHRRVAAMEEKIAEPPQKTRRDTLGHKVIAPRRANLRSAYFKHSSPQKPSPKKASPFLDTKNGSKYIPKRLSTTASESSGRVDERKKISLISNMDSDKTETKRWSTSSSLCGRGKALQKPQSTLHREVASTLSYSTNSSKEVSTYNGELPDDTSDSDSDAFGTIRRTSTIDHHQQEEKIIGNLVKAYARTSNSSHESASTEIEDDDFAAILQYQLSVDEDENSEGDETVSTIQRHRLSLGSSTVMSGGTASTMVRRSPREDFSVSSGDTKSTFVHRSSAISGSTAPTVVRRERDLAVPRESHASYPPSKSLPFRDAAPVRPNEQYHRTAPGALVLSPMQRTPMQALKWRALAAAEKEKTDRNRLPIRKSLSERNTNVAGH